MEKEKELPEAEEVQQEADRRGAEDQERQEGGVQVEGGRRLPRRLPRPVPRL